MAREGADSGQDPRLDQAVRLFQYLAAAQRLITRPPRTYEAYERDGEVLWLYTLPVHSAVRSAHTVGSSEPAAPVLEIDRVPTVEPPQPDSDLRPWIEGELDDPTADPRFADALDAADALRPSTEHDDTATNETDPPARAKWLEDHPEIRRRLDAWLQAWRAWAEEEHVRRETRAIYRRLFQIYLTASANPEDYEVVVGVGCLGWQPDGHDRMSRHLFTCQVAVSFDDRTGALTVERDDASTGMSVEDDMLDPGLVRDPEHVTAIRTAVSKHDEHPLDRAGLGELARRLVHCLDPDGEYQDRDDPPSALGRPVVTFAPALVLRRRSQRGLLQALETVAAQLRQTAILPDGLVPLIDPDHQPDPGLTWDERDGALVTVDDDPFLPLPVNQKQLEILRKVDSTAQVLVQGPPGTGKTHTCAVLIAHLLAQGKRVLVTAHTDRALTEVRSKLPRDIRPLAVSVIGTSREEMSELKQAVRAIRDRAENHDPVAAETTINTCLDEIHRLRSRRAEVHRKLLDARERETRRHMQGAYQRTLAQIARENQADAIRFSWLEEFAAVGESDPAPLSDNEIVEWWALLLDDVLARDADEAASDLPELATVPSPEVFAGMVERERSAAARAAEHADLRGHPAFTILARLEDGRRREVQQRLHSLANEARELAARREPWMNEALDDVRSDRDGIWTSRYETVSRLVERVQDHVDALGPLAAVNVAPNADLTELAQLAAAMENRLQGGRRIKTDGRGRPKMGAFAGRAVREASPLFEQASIDGSPPTTLKQLEKLRRWIEATDALDALDLAWPQMTIPKEDTFEERLSWHVNERLQLGKVLAFARKLKIEERHLQSLGIPKPNWHDLDDVRRYSHVIDAVTDHEQHVAAQAPLDDLARRLGVHAGTTAQQCARDLDAAVGGRDASLYRGAHRRLAELHGVRARLSRRNLLEHRLSEAAPRLRDTVVADPQATEWETRLSAFSHAWHWASTRAWLRAREALDVNALQSEISACEDAIRRQVERLAATRAWTHVVSGDRLTKQQRADLESYALLVRKLGKGKGRYAGKKRAAIRQAMDRCRSSVPVWIMPIYRVVEQLRMQPDSFDVVIVDEASQAGLEALALQYLAPKMVVIGDDKQVSPTAVGIDRQLLHDLARQFLHDHRFRNVLEDPETSLFELAKMLYGRLITLVEHRRCVPEIIGFSNRIAYEPEGIRLTPVRQYGSDRLEPIKPVFLANGYTRGETLKINPVEAEAIVDQLEKCLADPRYDGLTFGVISLLGPVQAKEIEKRLMERIAPEEWVARQLRCGDAADFQGSERNVIFLSMVTAPEPGRRSRPLVRDLFVQRFNVAASRAQDQMWVFHSVQMDDLSNREDMRFQLLDYCYAVTRRSEAEDGERSPVSDDIRDDRFDSLFEQRVFNRLIDRGYRVTRQYEVERYRIDLVVVGAKARLAIECDGDEWHGPARYEDDLRRQRDLERCGWQFFRVRESAFYVDPAEALEPLWQLLDELEIHPSGWTPAVPEDDHEPGDPVDLAEDETAPVEHDVEPIDLKLGVSALVIAEPLPLSLAPARPARSAPTAPSDEGHTEPDPLPSPAVAPYESYAGTTKAVGQAYRADLIDGLVAIVAAEGPLLGERLLQVYVKASGGRRVGKEIGRLLKSAVSSAVRLGRLSEDDPLGEAGVKPRTYRLPEQPRLRLRQLGPRTLEQIPPLELAAHIRQAAPRTGWDDHERLFRTVLANLGLKRLTQPAVARLEQVLSVAMSPDTDGDTVTSSA